MENRAKKIGTAIILGLVPYTYYFFIRPKLLSIEKKLDQKIIGISEKELDRMKAKYEDLKEKS